MIRLHGEEQLTAAGLAEVQETAVGRRGQSYSLSSVPLHPPATLVHRYTVVAGPNMEEFDDKPEIAKWCKVYNRECNIIVYCMAMTFFRSNYAKISRGFYLSFLRTLQHHWIKAV